MFIVLSNWIVCVTRWSYYHRNGRGPKCSPVCVPKTLFELPWQNGFVERLIGSIRRECLDHIIVWNETSLRRTLRSYFHYYQKSRTHLALAKDAPEPRAVDRPENGRIVAIPQVGGLHHRYERRAA